MTEDTQPQPVQEVKPNEQEVTKYLIAILNKNLVDMHNGYFGTNDEATRAFFTRSIQRLENLIADNKKKLPNGIWS